jgi:hypothetical protein
LAWLARGGWIRSIVGHEPGRVIEPGRGNGREVSRLAMAPGLAAKTAAGPGTEAGKSGHGGRHGPQERLACRGAPGLAAT